MKTKIYLIFLCTAVVLLAFRSSQTAPQHFILAQTEEIFIPLVMNNYPPVFSIAYKSGDSGSYDIWIINTDGSGQKQLTDLSGNILDFQWSPGKDRLAFSSNHAGNYEIYTVDVDGSNLQRITNEPASDYEPLWSSDGTKIYFRSNRLGTFEIFQINADGSGEVRLTDNDISETGLSLSKDGSWIAFSADGSLYLIKTDGTDEQQITDFSVDGVYVYDKDWSPDGTTIVFRGEINCSTTGCRQEIFSVKTNGADLTNLTDSSIVDLEPKWSPNGSKILFTCNFDICTMNPDGSDIQVLAVDPESDGDPSWAPNSQMVAFSSNRDGNAEIYVVNVNNTNLRRLTNSLSTDWYPLFSP